MMRAAVILLVVGVMVGALAAAAPAVDTNQAFLWNGVHWQQVTTEGKAGYIFGIGNLADYEVAASKGRKLACVSRAFVDDDEDQNRDADHPGSGQVLSGQPREVGHPSDRSGPGAVDQALSGGGSARDDEKMRQAAIVIMVAALLVGGCSGMSTTQQRTLSGGAIGASSGALIGWAAGCPACGAAIGGGAGLLGGYAYDQYEKSQGRP